jgi:large repetitive protein
VKLSSVSVTDIAPAPAGGDVAPTNEFVVGTKLLRVDDLLFTTLPLPVVGVNYTTLTGVLAFRNANSKLEPRSAADYVVGDPVLTGLTPTSTSTAITVFTRVGYTNLPTIPATAPLTVQLSGNVTADTLVALSSSDPTALTVPATVTVPAGKSSVVVPVTGIARSAAVTITATLATATQTATVRVLQDDGTSDVPTLTSLTPTTSHILDYGQSATLTVGFDLPLSTNETGAVNLGLALAATNGWAVVNIGTVQTDTMTATFQVTQPGAAGATSTTVSAEQGTNTPFTAAVSIFAAPVVNEVDYDEPGTDMTEFVEIYNPSKIDSDLSTFKVVFVNATKEYLRIPLTGKLAAGGYLVITTGATVPTGVNVIPFATPSNNITNSDNGAVVILDTSTTPPTIVDAITWGTGGLAAATITGFSGTVNLNEGTQPTTALVDINIGPAGSTQKDGSIVRTPNGQDTNNASADLKFTSTVTAGAANVYTP